MMSRSLNTYFWAGEPLDGEAAHNEEDIIVEASDIEDSPLKKAERQRRREQIGRRYLVGYLPFIQTAQLRGPFSSEKGWTNPWKRHRKAPSLSTRPSLQKITSTEMRSATALEENESETLHEEKGLRTITVAEYHGDQVGLVQPYNTDTEDDVLEQMYKQENHTIEHKGSRRSLQPETALNIQGADSDSSDGEIDILDASQEDLEHWIERRKSKDIGQRAQEFSNLGKKRKADDSWLNGAHMLRRSRHEVFEHSSPTPVAGRGRTGIARQSRQTFAGGFRSTTRHERLEVPHAQDARADETSTESWTRPQMSAGDLPRQNEETADGSGFPSVQNRVKDDDVQSILDPLPSSPASDDSIINVAQEYQVIDYRELDSEDVTGCYEASHLALKGANIPTVDPTRLRCRLEITELAPSDIDNQGIKSLKEARKLSHLGAVSARNRIGDHTSISVDHLQSDMNAFMDEGRIRRNFDETIQVRYNTSPVSAGSFQYRRTDRKSEARRTVTGIQEEESDRRSVSTDSYGDDDAEDVIAEWTEYAQDDHGTSIPFDDSEDLEVAGGSGPLQLKRRGTRPKQESTPDYNSDVVIEIDNMPSPDPLSEGFPGDYDMRTQRSSSDRPTQNNSVKEVSPQSNESEERYNRTSLAGPLIVEPEMDVAHRGFYSRDPPELEARQQSMSESFKDYLRLSKSPSTSLRHPSVIASAEATHSDSAAEPREHEGFPMYGTNSSQPQRYHERGIAISPPHNLQLTGSPRKYETLSVSANHDEARPNSKLSQRAQLVSKRTPQTTALASSENLSSFRQSPWVVSGVEVLQPVFSLDFSTDGSFDGDDDDAEDDLPLVDTHTDDDTPQKTLPATHHLSTQEDGPHAQALINRHPSPEITPRSFHPFPSTQVLLDAATANPWTSALKKPKANNGEKRVSFGPLPSDDVGSDIGHLPKKPSEHLGSPPPPAGTLRLTHLDDQFHYRLKATENLEVTEESLTKFMNTPWDKIKPITPRTKPPLESPGVDAMAEAFIAADRESSHSNLEPKITSKHGERAFKLTEITDKALETRSKVVEEKQRSRSSSLNDEFFSIAPNGKVTAVDFELPDYNAEDNLEAVIEDMGSFLEGWDVDSELKKAKANRFDTGNDLTAGRRRGYLSGISYQ
jgi:hypothetical protein